MPRSKKIVLVQPKNVFSYNNYPPLSLISVGSALKEAGYEVRLICAPRCKGAIDKVLAEADGALFAGITLLTSEIPSAVEIARALRIRSDVPILWGGWHVTLFPEQMLKSELVDYIAVGEGEESAVELANSLSCAGSPSSRAFLTKSRLDMEALPMPDYDLVEGIENYIADYLADKLAELYDGNMRWLPYQTSRGCPHMCAFCINAVTNNRHYRAKSARKVLDEVEALAAKYSLTHLKIIDDLFFVDMERVWQICQGLLDRRLPLTWDAECRVDYFGPGRIDNEMLRLMRASGCVELTMGIESGSPHSLKLMRKGLTPEQSLEAVEKCCRHGIIPRCSFVLDVPGDRREDILMTAVLINRLRRYPLFSCGVQTFRPYPKSDLCEQLLAQGKLIEPKSLEEWAEKDHIEQYTFASEARRRWQANYKLSSRVSFYNSLESSVWIPQARVKSRIIRAINRAFMAAARWRNRRLFYAFPLDRTLYRVFKNLYFRVLELKERAR